MRLRPPFVGAFGSAAALAAAGVLAFAESPSKGQTVRASIGTAGEQGDGDAYIAQLSANGRFVAFDSRAANLVAGDTNGRLDVYVRDLGRGTLTRASVDSAGAQNASDASDPVISGNGRFVAFVAKDGTLTAGDTNGVLDVFVRDLKKRTTTRVSVSAAGVQGTKISSQACISGNGRYVGFVSQSPEFVDGDTNGAQDVFVRDMSKGTLTRVSVDSAGAEANGSSSRPVISADGRFVAFVSSATNLVAGDTNGFLDVFVRDLKTGTTTRVSVNSAGAQATGNSFNPSISARGRFVAFASTAENLVADDTNNVEDFFVHDLETHTTTRVNLGAAGAQATGGDTYAGALDATGRFVVLESNATNLVPGDTNGKEDVFVRDLKTGTTTRLSVDSMGAQGTDGDSYLSSIDAKARIVAFVSNSSNLVAGDTNGAADVFVRRFR